jgi:hypothetical protein
MLDLLKLLIPTRDQMTSYIRTGIKWSGGALAGYGIAVSPQIWAAFAGPEAVQVYTGIAMAVVTALVDRVIHSDAGKVKSASTVPGIESIKVLPTATQEVKAVADDPKVPNVKPAVSTYFPPTPAQRK